MEDYWNKHVHCQEDIIKFYTLYFPYLPEVLVKALAIHMQGQVDGTIPVSEQFYRNSVVNKEASEKVWDYKKDIEEELMKGKINLATQRLDKLLEDDDEEIKQKECSSKKKSKTSKHNG